MDIDYQRMFDNLTELLKDICQFLSSDKLEMLSHRDKKLVETLINRSKVQLQEIAKIEMLPASEEYVDMDANKVNDEKQETLDIYSSVDDVNKTVGNIGIQDEIMCPYLDLPAKEASRTEKCGDLAMKRKFWLGFEKMKRVYGTIHQDWLLIYHTENYPKPCFTFYLKNYEAKADTTKDNYFELISTSPNQKVFTFVALTAKDRSQWVVKINRCHDNVVIQNKTFDLGGNIETISEDSDNNYDFIPARSDNPEPEEFYYEVADIRKPYLNNNTGAQNNSNENHLPGPPLPERCQKEEVPPALPLPNFKTSNSTYSSSESFYDTPDVKTISKENESEDPNDEDDKYEVFVNFKANNQKRFCAEEAIKEGAIDGNTHESNSIKEKIEKYQKLPDFHAVKNEKITSTIKQDESNEGKNESFVHDLVRKASCSPKKSGTESSGETKVISLDSRVTALNPPVIPKVPVVPLKPKIRDNRIIGCRPSISNLRNMKSDHIK